MFHVKHYSDPQQEQLFREFLKQWNLELQDSTIDNLFSFCDSVVEHNKITNLVSANDSKKLLTRHIADSLIPMAYLNREGLLPKQGEWADMGSGAGFPVVPLAIAMPQLKFYAVEPRKKRCEFLRSVVQTLQLSNLEIVESTFEKSDFYDLDFISCRALGSLEDDFKRAIPGLKKNGSFLTLKSWNSLLPMQEAKHPLLSKAKLIDYSLPQEVQNYVLVHLRSHG